MNRLFIGFDERSPVAFSVAQMSALKHSTRPLAITPLVLNTLPLKRHGLTQFTFSRFLVPYLCGYEGVAAFVDSDVMFRGDVSELFDLYEGKTVAVVKHEKVFERPSVMLFNCAKCTALTPSFVENDKNPLKLDWAWPDVGQLPAQWNHLVGYDAPNPAAKLAHFTQGLPCYHEHERLFHAEFGQEWRELAKLCMSTQSWEALMGSSVHVPHVTKAA